MLCIVWFRAKNTRWFPNEACDACRSTNCLLLHSFTILSYNKKEGSAANVNICQLKQSGFSSSAWHPSRYPPRFYAVSNYIAPNTPFPTRPKTNPAAARQTHHSRPHSVKRLYFVSVHPMQKQQKLDIRLPPDAYVETHNMPLYLKYSVKNALSFSNGMMSIWS